MTSCLGGKDTTAETVIEEEEESLKSLKSLKTRYKRHLLFLFLIVKSFIIRVIAQEDDGCDAKLID